MTFHTPPAEVEITHALVAALLVEQHPDLAHLPLRPVDEGWDNAMFRLGDELMVRLPRREAAATLIEHEQRWLPHIAAHLTLPIPAPLRVGVPALGFPWRWSVVPWIEGEAADLSEPDASQAPAFARFLRSLHIAAPADAPINPVRGGSLHERTAAFNERIQHLNGKSDLITPQIHQIWHEALAAPYDVAPTWIHGDLHARNVVIKNGTLAGMIDWGDIAAGDCATDLAAIWMLFDDPHAHRVALDVYAPSEATIRRAKGWAVHFGAMLLLTGLADHPRHAVMGARTLRRVTQ